MTTTPEYLQLVTSQHRQRPRFMATVQATVAPLSRVQDVLRSLVRRFDLDDDDPVEGCNGQQLDILGLWIGRSRRVSVPIEGVFFTWRGTATEGWRAGRWRGRYESGSAATIMPDDLYRQVLKGKRLSNQWDGSKAGQYAIVEAAFGAAGQIRFRDHQDMTQTVLVQVGFLSDTQRAILEQGLVPITPAGVGTDFQDFDQPQFLLNVFLSGGLPDDAILWELIVPAPGVAFAPGSFVVGTSDEGFTDESVLTWKKSTDGGVTRTPFCTMTFAATAKVCTVTMAEAVQFAPNDLLSLHGPAGGDETARDFAFDILGEYLAEA